ncbi:hypothetical protein [Parasitella parasitica]|uniref:Uncharacterized protein n=1 Tax=Parasitella parasitica TaxID=35722 RepID=A0A0B7MP83_9FUNG|nr:hypothetical protein [Parasitella parasitica]
MEFASFGEVKNLVFGLPTSVFIVIVLDNHTKEQFKLAAHISKRDFTIQENTYSIICKTNIRQAIGSTPLVKKSQKYAILSLEDFIPIEIFQKFSNLDNGYKAVINATPFDDNAINNADSVESAIHAIKDLLIHCVVRSQQNNWIFVTQVEAYYHNKNVDDVAQVDKKDRYPQKKVVKLEKCQEGKGSWQRGAQWELITIGVNIVDAIEISIAKVLDPAVLQLLKTKKIKAKEKWQVIESYNAKKSSQCAQEETISSDILNREDYFTMDTPPFSNENTSSRENGTKDMMKEGRKEMSEIKDILDEVNIISWQAKKLLERSNTLAEENNMLLKLPIRQP